MKYACRKCRTVVFENSCLAEHEVSQQSISYRKMSKDRTRTAASCTSYFLDEAKSEWIRETACRDVYEGKLDCPKCETRLGTFNWAGSQCSCGTWVTPSLKIIKSKIDVCSTAASSIPIVQSTVPH